MKINLPDISQIAKKFLEVLDREEIQKVKDLTTRLGLEFGLEGSQDFVRFDLRPSGLGTSAHTISYIRPGVGIPIEFKVNIILYYTQSILKTEEIILGYSPFGSDVFGNVTQNKLMNGSDVYLVRNELKTLSG